LIRKSEYDKALSDLNTGIEKDPRLPFCYYARGELYFGKGDYKSAIDDFTIGLRIRPNVQGLTTRGEAYERLGDRERALADFKAALEIDPRFKDAQEGEARLKQTQD
jgi:tetratricopeptide (TPR) repeat protein